MTRTREQGYNLIEVIIAVGLLAWVLISIAGLFALGQKGVHSGNLQTKAASIGQEMMEDLRDLGKAERYTEIGATANDSTFTTTITPMAVANVDTHARDSVEFKAWLDGLSPMDRWRFRLRDLPLATVDVTIDAQYVKDSSVALSFDNCVLIRFNMDINFTQGLRSRSSNFRFAL